MTTMRIRVGAVAALLVLGLLADAQPGRLLPGDRAPSPRVATCAANALSRLPLYFVENRGVYPEEVKYHIPGADKTLFLANDGVTVQLRGHERSWAVKLDFVDANPKARPEGLDRQEATFSYFKGPEKDWKTGLPSFSKVVYREVWPGIDLVYNAAVNALKYEFIVAPGTEPSRIRLRYRGADRISLTSRGGLRVETPEGGFEDAPPVAYQDIDGKRVGVEMRYALAQTGAPRIHEFGFDIGDYDRTRPLVLDPAVVVYCGYIGGVEGDAAASIAVDREGNAYLTGRTDSWEQTFPVAVGPDLTYNGRSLPVAYDAFVAKVNARGTELVYCGYIGGSGQECGEGIAVDGGGNAYVSGWTNSSEQTFPVLVGPDLTANGNDDAFVAKVNATGTALIYCGYLGGDRNDQGCGIAVDAMGNAYLTGTTTSREQTFPLTVGPDLTYNGHVEAFVGKVDPAGTALVYCGYIGGGGPDNGWGVAVDGAGCAYVTGDTYGQGFPEVVGPDLTHNGLWDVFVAKVDASGTGFLYSGYIGGARYDRAGGPCSITVDSSGSAYVTGWTESSEGTFPVRVGPYLIFKGGQLDAFVAKVSAAGSALVYCGYLAGGSDDVGHGIAVNAIGEAHVTGSTGSWENDFPVMVGPDLTFNGWGGTLDAFVAKVNAAGTGLIYCGYIGGDHGEGGYGIAVDSAGNAYVAGGTDSTQQTFPVIVGPDLTFNGGGDGFVAKVALMLLVASGRPGIGAKVNLELTASDSTGLTYLVGSSLGTGPIPIDQRQIELSPDNLLVASVGGYLPSVFRGYMGVIAATGTATATIQIPNAPALVGVRIYSAFVTLKPSAPSGVQSISNTVDFTIEK
ncbi:MAG: SBBP repeat-containing protein [Polyangiaceae bacterium]|nr:SBBP repeat-containing protein [Polyangiaceae bacterium]